MKLLAPASIVAIIAGLSAAQTSSPQKATQPGDITGIITEAGLDRGVPDAEISVRFLPPRVIGPGDVLATVKTDSQGSFRFPAPEFGRYILFVTKDGYTSGAASPKQNAPPTIIDITLDADHPNRAVRFSLSRVGELTGRVIDAETEAPIVGLTITAQPRYYQNGFARLFPSAGGRGVTDAEGWFRFKGLAPNLYAIVVPPREFGKDRLMTRFSEEDFNVIDQDYPTSYWPGGGDMDSVQAVSLVSGGSVDAGTIKLRKTNFYRIKVALANNNCEPGSIVKVMMQVVHNQTTQTDQSKEAMCGQPFLLKHYEPGSYSMILTQGEAQQRDSAVVPVFIRDKNVSLTAALEHGVDITGRFIVAEGAGPIALDQLHVSALPLESVRWADAMQPVTADALGGFRLLNRSLSGKLQMSMRAAPNSTYYVKEIRYNGTAVANDVIDLNAGSPAQNIEIVVDDQPANITGTVKDGDRDVDQPYVVLVKWPLAREFNYSPPKNVTGSAEGAFRFGGLAPGEYRIFAVSQVLCDKLDEPGVMQRVAERAEKLTIGRGSSQTVTLKLSDPSR